MDALILGGQSPRHKEWVRQLAAVLQTSFDKVAFVDYRHWSIGGESIDINYEVNQASDKTKELGKDYIIVAKSIGTIVTLLGVERHRLSPLGCLLMGLPLGVAEGMNDFYSSLNHLPATTFVQNEQDPIGSSDDVFDYLKKANVQSFTYKSLTGNTHDYLDFDLIQKLAKDL